MRLTIIYILLLLFSANLYAGIKEFNIECTQEDFDAMYENALEDYYINITISDESNVWENCRMRVRGDDSRKFPKKSLKVVFDAKLFYDNREKINFNAEWTDPSYIRQYLSARLFRESGHVCYDADLVRLKLNGEFLGLYIMIENIDEEFLSSNDLDPYANLYKATKDGACLYKGEDYKKLWEKKTNEATDWDDLGELIDSLYDISDEDYYEFANRYLDYDAMVNIVTMNMLLGNKSTYYHNYYMYHDINNTDKWTMLPWDMDKSIAYFGLDNPYWITTKWWSPDNPYAKRAMIDDKIFADIKIRAKELSESIFNPDFVFPIIDSVAAEIEKSVDQDTSDNIKRLWDWQQALLREKEFIENRYNKITEQFEKCPRVFRVYPNEGYYDKPVEFHWNKAYCPNGDPVKYELRYGTHSYLGDEATIIKDIQDTFFVLNELPEKDRYFWKVSAINANDEAFWTDGTDRMQIFYVSEFTKVPCSIDSDLTLSADNSPYLLDCEAVVASNALLRIEAGVVIYTEANAAIDVHGGLEIEGGFSNKVKFIPRDGVEKWSGIRFKNNTSSSFVKNTYVENGYIYITGSEDDFVEVLFDGFHLRNTFEMEFDHLLFQSDYCDLTFINSTIINNNTGQGVHVRHSKVHIENCYIDSLPDAIEFIFIEDGLVKNNLITNSGDDGIDFNASKNTLIVGNTILNAKDNGISIGWDWSGICENITVERNLVSGAAVGVTVKSGSDATLINNTLHNCNIGLKCYQKFTQTPGGGKADVVNTIFSECNTNYTLDDLSEASFAYCLSTSGELPGEGNIVSDPKFVNTAQNDFSLQETSPCIDAGDPNSEKDPDLTIADIGAFYYNQVSSGNIVINEINYNSNDSSYCGDWIEFYNASDFEVNLTDWYFQDSNPERKYTFPEISLAAGEYLVLVRDSLSFKAIHPSVNNYIGQLEFGMSGSGEFIRLMNSNDELVDSLTYMDREPWPEEADGTGATLELNSPELDNSNSENWHASSSTDPFGTPGRKNSIKNPNTGNKPNKHFLYQSYPNPADEKAVIGFYLESKETVIIEIFDVTGKKLKRIVNEEFKSGFSELTINTSKYAPGVYYYSLVVDDFLIDSKLLIIQR